MYMSVNHIKIQAMENVVFTENINFESSSYLSYDLQVSEESEIAGLTIEIKYDSQQLKIIKGEVGEVLLPTINKLNTQRDESVILTAISTDPIMKEGNILHLEFELVDSTKQYVEINCIISECINQKCDELPIVVKPDKIANPQYILNGTNGEISDESTETKEVTEAKDETPKTNEVIQDNTEKNDEISDEDKRLQTETEVEYESSEPTDTSKKSHQDVKPTDGGASKKEKATKSENKIILITVVIVIIGVTLLISTTWIGRKKK